MQVIPANRSASLSIAETSLTPVATNDLENLEEFLLSLNVSHQPSEFYWQVGEIQKTQGWIIHLSIIRTQLTQLINMVVPELIAENIPFKIPRTKAIAEKIIGGYLGMANLNKVICIYPPTDELGAIFAAKLIDWTKDFKGPVIVTDFCLGNIVYTRYGSFSPIWVSDSTGKAVRNIYNKQGDLVHDLNAIPFSFPSGVNWPFYSITEPFIPKSIKLINGRYYPILTMRKAPRGEVMKAIYFNRLWDIKACILKRGHKHMWSDDHARDVSDRLKWQYELCRQLEGIIPLPKVFDYFVENGDTFLAMEFVKGATVDKWILEKYQGKIWLDMPPDFQIQVLTILEQTIEIVQHLHEKGFVHRDITPGNFIITKRNKVIPIDLELAYSLQSDPMVPPFLLGTDGFMSPQQENEGFPSYKDDIYALGSLMMAFFTNLGPQILKADSQLLNKLFFFTDNMQISQLIVDCLQNDPDKRPHLDTLKKQVQLFHKKKSTITQKHHNKTSPRPDQAKLEWTIQAGINGLASPKMLSSTNRWLSIWREAEEENDKEKLKEEKSREYFMGWHTGMSGPLWLVAQANSAGFDISCCVEAYRQSWDYIINYFFQNSENSSLFYGGAGIALALSEGLRSGLLSLDSEMATRLKTCFSSRASELSLSMGIAGQGLALIYAAPFVETSFTQSLLDDCVNTIITSQLQDGSWQLPEKEKDKISMGLDDGISGIVWFLLAYYQYDKAARVQASIDRAMKCLVSNKSNRNTWRKLQGQDAYEVWFSGRRAMDTTLLLLKAFELLREPEYKKLAEKNLQTIPQRVVLDNLSLKSGIAKTGELFLEAYRILKNPAWLNRADWITDFLLHTFISKNPDDGYWPITGGIETADLFKGNSGVIRYLIKYMKQGDLVFPI